MKKRFLSLILALSVTLSMTACGSHAATEGASETATVETEAEKETETGTDVWEDPDGAGETGQEQSSEADGYGTASPLGEELETAIGSLDTDYSKIAWGVTYSPFENSPGIVFSIAPALHENDLCMIVAVTNLYSGDVDVSGYGTAKGMEGEDIAVFTLSAKAIGGGSTYLQKVDCSSFPSGQIKWEDLEVSLSNEKYVPWEADWELAGSAAEDSYSLNYTITAEDTCRAGTVWALLLDSDHNIVSVYSAYDNAEGNTIQGSIPGISGIDRLGVTDAAIFVNPTAVQEPTGQNQ